MQIFHMLGRGGQPTYGKFHTFFADNFWKLPLTILWNYSFHNCTMHYYIRFGLFWLCSHYFIKPDWVTDHPTSRDPSDLKSKLKLSWIKCILGRKTFIGRIVYYSILFKTLNNVVFSEYSHYNLCVDWILFDKFSDIYR